MRKMYYRPQKVSSKSLLFLAVVSVAVVIGLRQLPSRYTTLERMMGDWTGVEGLSDRMVEASHQTDRGFETIHCRRVELGHPILDIHDPADTGMIGPSMSSVTSLPGHWESKLTSVNPNFAAVAMRLLIDAGCKPGDKIAIGCTGSFPALNIAVYCAAEAMELRPVIISSVAASQFGANEPDMLWPDMEKLLFEEGIIQNRSIKVSLGGFDDRAAGMSEDTRGLLVASIERAGLPFMDSRDDADAVERRMLAYAEAAEDDSYAAYINVGGGDASVGGTVGNDAIGEGLIRPSALPQLKRNAEANASTIDCVATRFLDSGVPVINMINTVSLAKEYKLPVASTLPIEVGQGGVYAIADMRRVFAVIGIVLISAVTALVLHPPLRLVQFGQKKGWYSDPKKQPQWMV